MYYIMGARIVAEVPLKPLGKEDIKKLELALIFGTLFRPDVIERIKNAEDRLTWLDSLVVAAAALARERAGYSVVRIADEVGRTEATIRNHLQGKTEAGKLVKETYELLIKSRGRLEIKLPEELGTVATAELENKLKEINQKLQAIKAEKAKLEEKLKEVEKERDDARAKVEELTKELQELKAKTTKVKNILQEALEALK